MSNFGKILLFISLFLILVIFFKTVQLEIKNREKKEGFINMNRILEESKLSVNQEHLNYAIWTILAIYVGIVLIKVMRN